MTKQLHFWEYILRILKYQFERKMHSYVHSNIIYSNQALETAQVPISRLGNKKATQWNTTQHLKQNKEILPFATAWVDLEIIKLNEISQSEKDKYHMILSVCGI